MNTTAFILLVLGKYSYNKQHNYNYNIHAKAPNFFRAYYSMKYRLMKSIFLKLRKRVSSRQDMKFQYSPTLDIPLDILYIGNFA